MTKTIAIIGGGVVGLNIALAISDRKLGDVFLLEKEPYLGHHTSSRNSEVIHAGLAYPPGSLKARFCVEGNRLTYDLLTNLNVPFKNDGKWIVAYTEDEVVAIDRMIENATAAKASGVSRVTPEEVLQVVPILRKPKAAAFSKTTGIMDASTYIESMKMRLINRDGVFVIFPCEVNEIDAAKHTLNTTNRGDMDYDIIINAAGLFSDDIYRMAGGKRDFQIKPYKGEYYTWRLDNFDALIYPVPKSFLPKADATQTSNFGIHMHKAVGGEVYLGPSQVAAEFKDDYTINTPPEEFIESVSYLVKEKPSIDDVMPAFAGNRPKLFESGEAVSDFEIFRDGDIIHLLGIESPGLTAAPAIANYVVSMI
ncbi:MAG: NAD(P)/FAD-dependent oxidoreductase [Deltaproteobacteria bacterium]|jgi:L-2-hydroxyglutarate oxidase LhgO|nr:NAD(P)/FAD-dependent oxidoreductase [Deltaproteobacteria bacterium]